MIKIEVISQLAELLKLKHEWDNLHEESDIDHPFLTFEWISCFWRSYGKDKELIILTAREGGKMVGIAPLMKTRITHRGFRFKAVTFIADYFHTSRAGFILSGNKKEALTAMIEYLRKTDSLDDVCLFPYLVKDSENEILLSDTLLNKIQKNHITIPCLVSPYIKINQSWDNYFKTRSKNFCDNFTKLNNRYKRAGNFEIIKYTDRDIEEAIQELLSVSRNTWQYDNGTAIASTEANIEFYSSFIKKAAVRGWLNLWILRKNDKPIAFVYDLVYKDKEFGIKTGYDKEYCKDSPGEYLIGNIIKKCFDDGMTEFEMLGGPNSYKLRWTTLSRAHIKYMMFGNTLYGKLLRFAELSLIPALRKIWGSLKSIKMGLKDIDYQGTRESTEK